ncbi:MAG: hypothetical protein MUF25_00550 [Pirellulaceae bacterium]|nr:hypothetical protein [Pirellulaceae bacterium]
MKEHDRFESVIRERAVLVRVITSERLFIEEPLAELRGLATTAGTVIVGELSQRRAVPDCTTYLGHGKVAELKQLVAAAKADVVVFDNDLNPAQTRNLEKELQVKVIDRTELILDIFASNARTHEARCAAPARNNWRWTGAWWRSGSPTCAPICARSKPAANARWRLGTTT